MLLHSCDSCPCELQSLPVGPDHLAHDEPPSADTKFTAFMACLYQRAELSTEEGGAKKAADPPLVLLD